MKHDWIIFWKVMIKSIKLKQMVNVSLQQYYKVPPDLPKSNADEFRDSISDFLSAINNDILPLLQNRLMIEQLNTLRNCGVWNSNIADCMPLALQRSLTELYAFTRVLSQHQLLT